MPKVLEVYGFTFYFFAADCNERAHVHVKKGDGIGKIWIQPEIEVFYLKGFKIKEEKQILNLVTDNLTRLIKHWNDYCNNR